MHGRSFKYGVLSKNFWENLFDCCTVDSLYHLINDCALGMTAKCLSSDAHEILIIYLDM